MSSSLPEGWSQKESKSHPGKPYYINSVTGETTWTRPTSAAVSAGEEVQVLHILRKHRGSRRPASWRKDPITQSKEEATAEIQAIITRLRDAEVEGGASALVRLFQEIASTDSDCGSHERGGDLGMFGRGQMQRPFEDTSFALGVNKMSGIVDTDSGIHVILRIR